MQHALHFEYKLRVWQPPFVSRHSLTIITVLYTTLLLLLPPFSPVNTSFLSDFDSLHFALIAILYKLLTLKLNSFLTRLRRLDNSYLSNHSLY